MSITTTIRSELEEFMEQQGLNLSQLGKRAGINPGTVSSILRGNRVMAVDQLDRMTEVLALPPGHFYEPYIQECMVEAVPNWRRICPLLYRCAELDKLDCIREIVALLMDSLTYSAALFEVAEDFFQQARHAAAAILYEAVADSERRQHSERLALCQYRLFSLSLGDDQMQNFKAACQFEPFIDRLDEMVQLDALRDLANIYRSLRRWDRVYEIAEEMEYRAKIQYGLMHKLKNREDNSTRKTTRPIFAYIAYSNLLRASVYDAKGDYKQALHYTYAYADLSWVKETDAETREWKDRFRHWARTNTYINKLMSGDTSVLAEYVEYIKDGTDFYTEILNIVDAANRYHLNIDPILERFQSQAVSYPPGYSTDLYIQDLYTQLVLPEQSARLWYELAKYYLNKGRYTEGFKYLLGYLEKSSTLNNKTAIIKSVGLFESFTDQATPSIHEQYQNLIEEVWEKNEKEDSFALSCC